MKRIINSSNEVVLTSKYFDLVKRSGMSIYNVPWNGYEVVSKGAAKDHVVGIDLDQKWVNYKDYEGQEDAVVNHTYTGCHINYGLPGRVRSDDDIEEFIKILEEALVFEEQIRRFFRS